MARIVVISPRVRSPAAGGDRGGLAGALHDTLRARGGLWLGWSGEAADAWTGGLRWADAQGVTTAAVDLPDEDIAQWHRCYAERTLWPLFHHRLDLARFDRAAATGYQRVNARLAEVAAPLIAPGDLVWVYGHPLLPLGAALRERQVKARMGVFIPTPWPPAAMLVALPEHRALVEALFAYDVVGFQTAADRDAFLHFATTALDAERGSDGSATLDGRTVRAVAAGMGIDVAALEAEAGGEAARQARERMWMSATGRQMIVGVDRIDHPGGLVERFAGFDRLLRSYPDYRGLVYMLQIAPPTRDAAHAYGEIRATLEGMAGRINGEYADIDWTPLRYVNQGYARATLAGIYRAARVGCVTPLRDGMSLAAKEYVAAQDGRDPGVLVLSRFAGAAAQLKEAVLVNPYSADDLADGLAQALAMGRDERIERWEALIHNVRQEDVFWWRDGFVRALEGAG